MSDSEVVSCSEIGRVLIVPWFRCSVNALKRCLTGSEICGAVL